MFSDLEKVMVEIIQRLLRATVSAYDFLSVIHISSCEIQVSGNQVHVRI